MLWSVLLLPSQYPKLRIVPTCLAKLVGTIDLFTLKYLSKQRLGNEAELRILTLASRSMLGMMTHNHCKHLKDCMEVKYRYEKISARVTNLGNAARYKTEMKSYKKIAFDL